MPFTIPTIYAIRAVSIKDIHQRLVFTKNLYKFRSFVIGSTLLSELKMYKSNLDHYDYLNILNLVVS